MAVEVQTNQSLHFVRRRCKYPRLGINDLESNKILLVRYTYHHDVESTWWIAIWMFLRVLRQEASADKVQEAKVLLAQIFPRSTMGSLKRLAFIKNPVFFLETLPIYSTCYESIVPLLNANETLLDSYLGFSKDPEKYVQEKKFLDVYRSFINEFSEATHHAPSSVKFVDDVPDPLPGCPPNTQPRGPNKRNLSGAGPDKELGPKTKQSRVLKA